jgi:hypothetical protein
LDEIVRRRPATPNKPRALLKNEMNPDGCNSKREASNNKHELGAIGGLARYSVHSTATAL